MRGMLKSHGLDHIIECDSAGTSGYHDGEPADARMIAFAKQRGYVLGGESRQIRAPEDFEAFDYILTMDQSNHRNVLGLDREGRFHHKVHHMVKYCRVHNVQEVPDPYYQGDDGFHLVLDILEDSCSELLNELKQQVGQA